MQLEEMQNKPYMKTSNIPDWLKEIRSGEWNEDAWMDFSHCEGIIKYKTSDESKIQKTRHGSGNSDKGSSD